MSLQAEQNVIGGVLAFPEVYPDVAWLPASSFTQEPYIRIWAAIKARGESDKPIDVVLLGDDLPELFQLVVELASNTSSVVNIETYARVVADDAIIRNTCSRLHEIAGRHQSKRDVNGLLSEVEQAITTDRPDTTKSTLDLIRNSLDELDKRFNKNGEITGVKTGIKTLDQFYWGFEPGQLVVLGGRPSMGKTTLALNILSHAARSGHVHVFSLEMSGEELIGKLICALGGINYERYSRGTLIDQDWVNVTAGVSKLKEIQANITINDKGGIDISELKAEAAKVNRRKNTNLIIVDYVQIVQDRTSKTGYERVTNVSMALKSLAKNIGCPVLALAQVNRSCEQRPDQRPKGSDLKESGQLEQDADILSFIYRDEVAHEDSEWAGTAEIITRKFRGGKTGTVRLAAQMERSRFVDLNMYEQQQG